jgi:hypothetical protein
LALGWVVDLVVVMVIVQVAVGSNGLDSLSPLAALGLGAALSGIDPKNLALTASGAVAIGSGDLSTFQAVVCVVVFVVIASVLVVGPVVAFLVVGDRTAAPLPALKTFVEVHNAAIRTVLLGVLGLSVLGQGLGRPAGVSHLDARGQSTEAIRRTASSRIAADVAKLRRTNPRPASRP